jgi:hypothetical protein
MTHIPFAARLVAPTTRHEQAVAGPRFTATMLVLMAWFLAGLCIDGWAHNHGKVDQSFFTPWHAVFYSGFAAVVGGLGGMMMINRLRGYAWHQAIPVGYERGLTGAIIFAFGGLFDLVWHTLFGIERGIEALLSPSHLLLALGMILVLSSPMRAAWHASDTTTQQTWTSQLPLVLSITFTLTVITFLTAYLHPFMDYWPASWRGGDGVVAGMGSIMLQTTFLMGFVLMAVRHWRLAWGGLAVIFTLNALLMSVLEDTYPMIAVALVAGIGADTVLALLRPSAARPLAFRWFAIIVPVILYTCYLLAIRWTDGLTWTTHLITGAPVLAAAVGVGLSYLVLPPERTHAR